MAFDRQLRQLFLGNILTTSVQYRGQAQANEDGYESRDGLVVHVAEFLLVPGATAEVADFTEHHGHARATVNFLKDGKTMMQGQYYGRFAHGGQLAHLVGFNGTGA